VISNKIQCTCCFVLLLAVLPLWCYWRYTVCGGFNSDKTAKMFRWVRKRCKVKNRLSLLIVYVYIHMCVCVCVVYVCVHVYISCAWVSVWMGTFVFIWILVSSALLHFNFCNNATCVAMSATFFFFYSISSSAPSSPYTYIRLSCLGLKTT